MPNENKTENEEVLYKRIKHQIQMFIDGMPRAQLEANIMASAVWYDQQQTSELRKEKEELRVCTIATVEVLRDRCASLQSQLEEKDIEVNFQLSENNILQSEIKALKETNNALISIMNQHYEGLTIDEVLALPTSQDNKEKICTCSGTTTNITPIECCPVHSNPPLTHEQTKRRN